MRARRATDFGIALTTQCAATCTSRFEVTVSDCINAGNLACTTKAIFAATSRMEACSACSSITAQTSNVSLWLRVLKKSRKVYSEPGIVRFPKSVNS